MSGGYFEYKQHRITDILDKVEHLIRTNNDESLNEWGSMRGHHFSNETIDEFRKACFYLQRAQIYAHRIDWLVCGDDSEEKFHIQLKNELKYANDKIDC